MKIFKFDPATGKRGALIDTVRCISWTDQSADYQIKNGIIDPIKYTLPLHQANSEWTVHVDAGTDDNNGNTTSYLTDEWICFSHGEILAGENRWWEWVVLPPKQLIKQCKQVAH